MLPRVRPDAALQLNDCQIMKPQARRTTLLRTNGGQAATGPRTIDDMPARAWVGAGAGFGRFLGKSFQNLICHQTRAKEAKAKVVARSVS